MRIGKVWSDAVMTNRATIRDAIRNLDEVAIKIVLIVDGNGVFLGTVSDGDIRRALLSDLSFESCVDTIIQRNAIVVPPDVERGMVLRLMTANKIQQIPIVGDRGRVLGIHLWDEVTKPQSRQNIMVIMAGGLGTRLRPETDSCPKPLLPIAGKPMLEHIIERAKTEGFRNFLISIHYLGGMIESYFGDGSKFGVQINYLRELLPLGTAGALGLIDQHMDLPFIVTNGDVMTDINYGEMLDFHSRNLAVATMAVRTHEWQNPFGVVQTRGIEIISIEEKPIISSYINAGIYVLEPSILRLLDSNVRCDMPQLFEKLQVNNERVLAYPMHEPWLDIGRPEDLNIARSQQENS